MITARRDRQGWLNLTFLGDGRVEDKKERDVRRSVIIMRNWDLRAFHVQENLPFPIQQILLPIQQVLTVIQRFRNLIKQVVPQISLIRSYSPYHSHLHPASLFLIYNSTTIAEYTANSSLNFSQHHKHEFVLSTAYPEYSIHRVQHTPSTAYTEYSIHRVQHTPSTAYTEYSTHRVQHTPSTTASTPDFLSTLHYRNSMSSAQSSFSFRHSSVDDWPPSTSSRWVLQGKWTSSHSQSCQLTNWWIESQHPACIASTTCNYSYYLHLMMASECISTLPRSWPQSASSSSLDCCIQVYLQTHSITASKFPQLSPLHVHLQSRLITASECISEVTGMLYSGTP